MKRKIWTDEEVLALRKLRELHVTYLDISKKLNRTERSVICKARRLGLKGRVISRTLGQIPWNKGTKGIMVAWNKGRKCPSHSMEKNPKWKGGKKVDKNGYILVRLPEHPRASSGYVFEHILVMEQILKRSLLPGEVVHHINGIVSDNRPENLMLFVSNSEHTRYHNNLRRNVSKMGQAANLG